MARGTKWFARITYRYEVAGQSHVSSRTSFVTTERSALLRGGPSRENASAVAAEHAVGSNIRAYYDPTNPADAVLDPSPPARSLWVPIIALVVIVALASLLRVVPRTLGPQIPDRWVTAGILAGGVSLLALGGWYFIRALRDAARENYGTAFALFFIASLILSEWVRRVRNGRDAA